MPKRGDRVAPPPAPGEWDLRFGDSAAIDDERRIVVLTLATVGHPVKTE